MLIVQAGVRYAQSGKYLRYWKNHLSFDDGKIFAIVA
jgi:hypothetical protein